MVEMVMDEKGRILIPNEIRRQLQLKPGEKFQVKLEDGGLLLLKTTSRADFLREVRRFHEKLKEATTEPIPEEKLFD